MAGPSVSVVNACTRHGGGGSPTTVVIDDAVLTDDERHAIARRAGTSHTAFVDTSAADVPRVRFFTSAGDSRTADMESSRRRPSCCSAAAAPSTAAGSSPQAAPSPRPPFGAATASRSGSTKASSPYRTAVTRPEMASSPPSAWNERTSPPTYGSPHPARHDSSSPSGIAGRCCPYSPTTIGWQPSVGDWVISAASPTRSRRPQERAPPGCSPRRSASTRTSRTPTVSAASPHTCSTQPAAARSKSTRATDCRAHHRCPPARHAPQTASSPESAEWLASAPRMVLSTTAHPPPALLSRTGTPEPFLIATFD